MHVEDEEKRTVMISWDPLEDVAGWEEGGVSVQKLGDRKWRKHTKGAWMMEYIDKDDVYTAKILRLNEDSMPSLRRHLTVGFMVL